MPPFRAHWWACRVERVVDLLLHLTAAWLAPGPWWLQFLPDVLTPVLVLHGMITNRFLASTSPLLLLHKTLHSIWMPLSVGLVAALAVGYSGGGGLWFVAAHWGIHLGIDYFTHDNWRQSDIV